MDHVEHLRAMARIEAIEGPKDLLTRVTGRFYTPAFIANQLVDAVLRAWKPRKKTVKVIEPFCGDGRLVALLLKQSALTKPRRIWEVTIWDCDQSALSAAKEKIIRSAGAGSSPGKSLLGGDATVCSAALPPAGGR